VRRRLSLFREKRSLRATNLDVVKKWTFFGWGKWSLYIKRKLAALMTPDHVRERGLNCPSTIIESADDVHRTINRRKMSKFEQLNDVLLSLRALNSCPAPNYPPSCALALHKFSSRRRTRAFCFIGAICEARKKSSIEMGSYCAPSSPPQMGKSLTFAFHSPPR